MVLARARDLYLLLRGRCHCAAAGAARICINLGRVGLGFAGLHGEQGCACGDWTAMSDI